MDENYQVRKMRSHPKPQCIEDMDIKKCVSHKKKRSMPQFVKNYKGPYNSVINNHRETCINIIPISNISSNLSFFDSSRLYQNKFLSCYENKNLRLNIFIKEINPDQSEKVQFSSCMKTKSNSKQILSCDNNFVVDSSNIKNSTNNNISHSSFQLCEPLGLLNANKICSICDYIYTTRNFKIDLPCGHNFCRKCLKYFYEDQIENGFYILRCPFKKCNAILNEFSSLVGIISKALMTKLNEGSEKISKKESSAQFSFQKYKKCPKCGETGNLFGKRSQKKYKCLNCFACICKFCDKIIDPNHFNIKNPEFCPILQEKIIYSETQSERTCSFVCKILLYSVLLNIISFFLMILGALGGHFFEDIFREGERNDAKENISMYSNNYIKENKNRNNHRTCGFKLIKFVFHLFQIILSPFCIIGLPYFPIILTVVDYLFK